MNSITFFLGFVPVLTFILLGINLIFATHTPYQEKSSTFECGFHSFLGQNRTQFTISFFVVALLFLIFDLELVLIYPLPVSLYSVNALGLIIAMTFFVVLTLGFAFEIGKKALTIESRQYNNTLDSNLIISLIWVCNIISQTLKINFITFPFLIAIPFSVIVKLCYHVFKFNSVETFVSIISNNNNYPIVLPILFLVCIYIFIFVKLNIEKLTLKMTIEKFTTLVLFKGFIALFTSTIAILVIGGVIDPYNVFRTFLCAYSFNVLIETEYIVFMYAPGLGGPGGPSGPGGPQGPFGPGGPKDPNELGITPDERRRRKEMMELRLPLGLDGLKSPNEWGITLDEKRIRQTALDEKWEIIMEQMNTNGRGPVGIHAYLPGESPLFNMGELPRDYTREQFLIYRGDQLWRARECSRQGNFVDIRDPEILGKEGMEIKKNLENFPGGYDRIQDFFERMRVLDIKYRYIQALERVVTKNTEGELKYIEEELKRLHLSKRNSTSTINNRNEMLPSLRRRHSNNF